MRIRFRYDRYGDRQKDDIRDRTILPWVSRLTFYEPYNKHSPKHSYEGGYVEDE